MDALSRQRKLRVVYAKERGLPEPVFPGRNLSALILKQAGRRNNNH